MNNIHEMQNQTDIGQFHDGVNAVVAPPPIDERKGVLKNGKKRPNKKSLPRAINMLEKGPAQQVTVMEAIIDDKALAVATVAATEAAMLFAEARAINNEYVKAGEIAEKTYKQKIQEAQPHLLAVNDFFAHIKNGQSLDGHVTAETWYEDKIGCSASYARRCLKTRKTHGISPLQERKSKDLAVAATCEDARKQIKADENGGAA